MINYPIKGKKTVVSTTKQQKKIDTRHRGISFEDDINASNQYYLLHEKAVIHKKPTPIQIVKVDYPNRQAAKIIEAYFKIPSTTDYNGVYKGRYIDFEAKETKRLNFPLTNIHEHQIKHLEQVLNQNGIAFVMFAFSTLNEVYLVEASYIIDAYRSENKKSVKYDEIKNYGHLVPQGYLPRLDYLKIIDNLYFKEEKINE